MRRFLKNKKGFTLIELIVVIAILGILAVIAIPRISGYQDDARVNADHSSFATLENVVAIAVTDGAIVTPAVAAGASTVILQTDANGLVTWGGTATTNPAATGITALMTARMTKLPVFQAAANRNAAGAAAIATWTINTDGTIAIAINGARDLQ